MANIFSTIGDVLGGFASQEAAKVQEAQAKIEKQMAKLREKQIAEASRRQLSSTLGTIDAIRAGRGVSGDSQTGQAIQRVTREDAYRSEAIQRLAEVNRAAAARLAQSGYAMQAKWAVPMAALGAFSGMLDSAASAFSGAPAPGG